jgi:homoserine kinase
VGAIVLVPATSANLGPGFDSFGLALDLHNRFEAELADEWGVDVKGEGAGSLSTGADNVVAVAMARAFAEAGKPGLRAAIGCANRIPTGSGLGSSSAAIVGGLLLGEALAGADFGQERRLEIAAELEGHPDNVAAALVGGFTVCWSVERAARCARFEPARGLAVVAVPALTELSTPVARAMLPDEVSHEDASFNVAHAGLLAASIAAGRPELFGDALADRLHEPYRAQAVGDLLAVADILRAAGAAGAARRVWHFGASRLLAGGEFQRMARAGHQPGDL